MTETANAREAILDAAESRFAAHGFAGTTIKLIAGAVGVNTALLYYYFADKEALYAAVIARLLGRLTGEMSQSMAAGASPDEAIRAFAATQGAVFAANPRMIKIVGRELIDHDARHAQAPIRQLAVTTFARLHTLVSAGQKVGIFRSDIDARFAAISIVAQTAYFHFARPAVEILLAGGKPLTAATKHAFSEHVAAFSLAALAALAPVVNAASTTVESTTAPSAKRRRPAKRTTRGIAP
jgi:TetR/AcrR family transcriptional regulator